MSNLLDKKSRSHTIRLKYATDDFLILSQTYWQQIYVLFKKTFNILVFLLGLARKILKLNKCVIFDNLLKNSTT